MTEELVRLTDGEYREQLGGTWMAEYREDPQSGLWTVVIFKHDAPEWREDGFSSLEDARQAARGYYDRL